MRTHASRLKRKSYVIKKEGRDEKRRDRKRREEAGGSEKGAEEILLSDFSCSAAQETLKMLLE